MRARGRGRGRGEGQEHARAPGGGRAGGGRRPSPSCRGSDPDPARLALTLSVWRGKAGGLQPPAPGGGGVCEGCGRWCCCGVAAATERACAFAGVRERHVKFSTWCGLRSKDCYELKGSHWVAPRPIPTALVTATELASARGFQRSVPRDGPEAAVPHDPPHVHVPGHPEPRPACLSTSVTTAKAFAKDVFINQERKLGDRRRSDTVVVLTINYADSGSVG